MYDWTVASAPGLGGQGSSGKAAGNTFSKITGRFAADINNTLGNNFTYYYNGAVTKNPSNSSNVTVTGGGSNNCVFTEDYGMSGKAYCEELITEYYKGSTPLLVRVTSATDVVTNIETGGITALEVDDYNAAITEYDAAMGTLIGYYSEMNAFDTTGTYNDSIYNLLSGYKTITGKYLMLDWYLERNMYTEANTLMTSMLSGTPPQNVIDYCAFSALMRDYRQSDYSSIWLTSNFSTLKSIADGSGYMAPRAKVLVQYAVDMDSTNIYHDSILYPFVVQEVTDTVPPAENIQMDVNVYPNPFDNVLNYSVTNYSGSLRMLTFKLTDIYGSTVFTTPVGVNTFYSTSFNSSGLPPTYYIFSVLEGGKVMYYTSKFLSKPVA